MFLLRMHSGRYQFGILDLGTGDICQVEFWIVECLYGITLPQTTSLGSE